MLNGYKVLSLSAQNLGVRNTVARLKNLSLSAQNLGVRNSVARLKNLSLSAQNLGVRSSKQIPQQKEIASNSFSVASFVFPLPKKFPAEYFPGSPWVARLNKPLLRASCRFDSYWGCHEKSAFCLPDKSAFFSYIRLRRVLLRCSYIRPSDELYFASRSLKANII